MTPGGNHRRERLFPELLAPLQALRVSGRVRVALSGGLDSMVLLHLAHQVFGHRPEGLCAIHVNHQLQPAAAAFEEVCRRACEGLGVVLEVVPVRVRDGEGSIETAARDARYQVFGERTGRGDTLLMAHHADDQMETLLFRFLRGSGVRGLAGMPAERQLGRGRLVRPLLQVSREHLHRQAVAAGIPWADDPSNAGTDHDRNFLRHRILSPLKQRWPGLDRRLAATARACDEAAELSQMLARVQFQELCDGPNRIRLTGLSALPRSASRNLLQWWLGEALARTLSDQELDDLLTAAEDARPEVRAGEFALRRFRGHIYRVAMSEPPLADDQPLVPGRAIRDGCFTVRLESDEPAGPAGAFHLSHRRGGERLRERPQGPARPLKKWLQEQGVPPWERDRLPLVFRGGELVAVADLWCRSAPGTAGWRLDIQRERHGDAGEF